VIQALWKPVPQELEETVNAMLPHPRWHGIFGSQPSQRRARRGMLGREKEVVVFVKQGPVEGDQSLPLIMVKFVGGIGLRALIVVDLDAFALH
jgi:hypothetical protein